MTLPNQSNLVIIMSTFILEEMALQNFTSDELIKKAEREENALAVRLYHLGKEEAIEEVEENMSGGSIHKAVDYLVKCMADKSCWQKDTDDSWYLTALHRDTNVFMHHVGIEKTNRAKVYKVYIESGPSGENVWWQDFEGLAHAKKQAIDHAIKFACHGDLKV